MSFQDSIVAVRERASAVAPLFPGKRFGPWSDYLYLETLSLFSFAQSSSEALVGWRVAVRWRGPKWFPGVVTAFDPNIGLHRIRYDDGDVKMYRLSENKKAFVLIEAEGDVWHSLACFTPAEMRAMEEELLPDAEAQIVSEFLSLLTLKTPL